jgi:uncharacterized membrane protein
MSMPALPFREKPAIRELHSARCRKAQAVSAVYWAAILLGLEVLVAADIIRTVAVTPTLTGVAVLAGIVPIRTFLSLEVELEGRFPWQAGVKAEAMLQR